MLRTAERGKVENAVGVKQGHRAGTGMVHGQNQKQKKGNNMKVSQFKDYSELPLFLNAEMVAKVLGVPPSSGYELMHKPEFPVLKIGSRMVVPKEKFIRRVEQNTNGGGN